MKTGFIDWTKSSLNIYVYERQAGIYALTDSLSYPLEDELDREALSSLSASGCTVFFLSIPLNLLTLREETFPFTDEEKIRDTLPYELEGMLLGDIKNYLVEHMIVESFDGGSKVLAICIETAKLKQIIDMFSSADLEPKVITSLDVRLSGGKSDVLLEETFSDSATRAEAARQEITDPSMNLRRGELSYMGDIVSFISKLRQTALLVLILVVVLAANSTFSLITHRKEHTVLTNEIQGMFRQIFPEDKKIIDPDRQFKGNMNTLLKKNAALSGIPVLDIVRNISLQNSRKVTLHEFNADGKNLILKGTAKTFEDVESLKNTLASHFKDVNVTDSGATADKKINFTLVMQERGA